MELPNDVLMEILSRLPLNKLGKTRSLSKSHAKDSHHSFFKELAAQRQPGPILDGFLFQDLQYNDYVFSFASPRPNSPPFDFSLCFLPGCHPQIRASAANGLLLVETRHPCHYKKLIYSICKPSTKQWKGIPIPRTRYFTQNTAIFVLCSNPLRFKILRLSRDQIPSKRPLPFSYTICELFDSESWRWKLLNDITEDSCSGFLRSHSAPIMAYGSAHWKISNETSIFAFDFYSETWSIIPLPDAIVVEYEDMIKNNPMARWGTELVEYEGKLGLMREFYEPTAALTELWVMDNYPNRIWTKRNGSLESWPVAFYGSDISVAWSFNKVMFSSLETGRCSSVKLGETHYGKPRMVFPFLSDFEPWNFQPPPRTLKPRAMAKILRKQLLLIQNNMVVLSSFSFFFACYNHCLCTLLLGILEFTLQNS